MKALCIGIHQCIRLFFIFASGNHDFSQYVLKGDGTHKIVCVDCGAVEEGHDKDACSGGTAACAVKAKCSKCKTEYGSLKAHTNTTTTLQQLRLIFLGNFSIENYYVELDTRGGESQADVAKRFDKKYGTDLTLYGE